MPNDVKLQSPEGKHPVDENLRPILVANKPTALEVAQHGDGCRVNGDLTVTGNIKGNVKDVELDLTKINSTDLTIEDSGDITLDAHVYIIVDANGTDIIFKDSGTESGRIKMDISGGSVQGDKSLELNSSTSTMNSLILKSLSTTGAIYLDSRNGRFVMQENGTEFSPTNSSYSGMLLGCTHVFGSGTGGTFVQIGAAWDNLLWDTDKYALVTFVVPPSNRVKISVHLPFIAAAGIAFQLGLATDSSDPPTTLNTKYENDVNDANRPDSFNVNYSWVVEGSDHSWSAGETKTLYIMAYAASNIRFYTGGTNTSGYGGVIVEATALPATIGDGSEP